MLRENQGHPVGRSLILENCHFDKTCVEPALAEVAPDFLLLSKKDVESGSVSLPADTLKIDYSLLTRSPAPVGVHMRERP